MENNESIKQSFPDEKRKIELEEIHSDLEEDVDEEEANDVYEDVLNIHYEKRKYLS